MGFSQTLKNSNSNTPVIPEGLDQSWEHGNHSKELVASSQSSVPKTKSKIHCTRHKTRGLNQIKSPEGTKRIGPLFPIKYLTRFQQSMDKINSNERNRGRDTQGRRPGETESPRTDYKSRYDLTQVKGYLYPRDRSDRYAGPVRPVGLQHPLYTISSDGRGSFFETKSSPRCHRLDEDPVRGFGGSAKPG